MKVTGVDIPAPQSPVRGFEAETCDQVAVALGAIRCNCLQPTDMTDGTAWWDTAIAPNDIEADLVAEGVAYLERVGYVVRHPDWQDWIQFR